MREGAVTSFGTGAVAQSKARRSLTGELSLIYAWSMVHFVGKVSAMLDQPTRPTQPSIPSGSANE